jgi:HlyD family secretion protein
VPTVDEVKAGKGWKARSPVLRALALAALVVALAAAAALVTKLIVARSVPAGITASGMIEATQSDLAPKVQGRLIDLRVHDGESVRKGQVLAVLDRIDTGLALDQARANVAAARAQVDAAQAAYALQRDSYETTLAQATAGVGIAGSHVGQAGENLAIERRAALLSIDQAQAQVLSARSAYEHSAIVLHRAQTLYGSGDQARQTLDEATNSYNTAAAQLRAAEDGLALARANARNVAVRALDVTVSQSQRTQSLATLRSAQDERKLVNERHAQLIAARGALAQAQAALGQAQEHVRETLLVAPYDGLVVSHAVEVGDLVQPGAAVLTIGDLLHPYVNVYVGEPDLPHVKTGARADVTVDGVRGRTYTGTVTEIATGAEFTPENVQTKEARIEYLVFRVKIQFTDTTGTLKPGLPVDAVIHV